MNQQLDPIDTIATKAFEGYVVRKDLVRKFKGQYPVPTYVAEFLLGRYCASVEEEEISDGLKIVERQLGEKTVRAGEHELFKARAKEKGRVKLIDIITARLDAGTDSFVATLPSLQLKDVRISEGMVHANERMLTGGFYAEVEVAYDPTIAQEQNGRPFGIESLREIQLSKREVLPVLYQGREAFATEEGKESIRADGSIVMVGNFDVDVQHQQRVGHLFGSLPPEMRDDTAFMDRIHAYLPGWDLPKVNRDLLTNHFGLVSDFLSECWNRLRRQSRQNLFQGRIHLGGALSGRDAAAVQKTVSGLIKLVSPNADTPVPDEVLEWASRIALECRRRVKGQPKRIGSAPVRYNPLHFFVGDDGGKKI